MRNYYWNNHVNKYIIDLGDGQVIVDRESFQKMRMFNSFLDGLTKLMDEKSIGFYINYYVTIQEFHDGCDVSVSIYGLFDDVARVLDKEVYDLICKTDDNRRNDYHIRVSDMVDTMCRNYRLWND